MLNFRRHLILRGSTIKDALAQLNKLAADSILFVVDDRDFLVGSLTDGDVRRGFLSGLTFDDPVDKFIQPNPRFLSRANLSLQQVIEFRNSNFRIIPIIDEGSRVIDVVNFRYTRSYLPLDVILMAGGRGERLKPLTDTVPKPLLKVGDCTILERNIKRLASFGVRNFNITIRYLGEQIREAIGSAKFPELSISFVEENKPMGTIGAVALVADQLGDTVLVANGDLLTNLDYEEFYLDFISQGADCSIVSIPYNVDVPYAVFETSNRHVIDFVEKPTYTYYSNGGIYLFRKECLGMIPQGQFFDATDLLQVLINKGKKVISYPIRGYWLDIGRPEDFVKAQDDVLHVKDL